LLTIIKIFKTKNK